MARSTWYLAFKKDPSFPKDLEDQRVYFRKIEATKSCGKPQKGTKLKAAVAGEEMDLFKIRGELMLAQTAGIRVKTELDTLKKKLKDGLLFSEADVYAAITAALAPVRAALDTLDTRYGPSCNPTNAGMATAILSTAKRNIFKLCDETLEKAEKSLHEG